MLLHSSRTVTKRTTISTLKTLKSIEKSGELYHHWMSQSKRSLGSIKLVWFRSSTSQTEECFRTWTLKSISTKQCSYLNSIDLTATHSIDSDSTPALYLSSCLNPILTMVPPSHRNLTKVIQFNKLPFARYRSGQNWIRFWMKVTYGRSHRETFTCCNFLSWEMSQMAFWYFTCSENTANSDW